MAYTTINKSTDYFNTKLYTGNGGTQSITGVGFQPDWLWFKKRNGAADSSLIDAVRGVRKSLTSNNIEAEYTETAGLSAFDSNGFSFDGAGFDHVNTNGDSFVAWNWKAGGGQGSSNTDGSINTTYTSVNTTAGFSISSYTGNATSGATIGHGLGVKPAMMIVKKLNGSFNWGIYHKNIGATKLLAFNTGTPDDDASYWNDTEPTSSVFYVGNGGLTNGSGSTMIAYCFAEKQGYSKFGSYVGNGSTDGTFVYTGFKPAFVMTKRTSATSSWEILDNKRDISNPTGIALWADSSSAENDYVERIDLLSNGFKLKTTSAPNASGSNQIYMAFAEAPLVGTNNVPCTAR